MMTIPQAMASIAENYPCATIGKARAVIEAVIALRLQRPHSGGISGASYTYDDAWLDRIYEEARAVVESDESGGCFARGTVTF